MNKALIVLLVAAAWSGEVRSARAQSAHDLLETGYLNVDIGAQPQRRTITAANSFPLYDEVATVTSIQRIRNGAVFDISGGMRVADNLAIGLGLSQFGRSGTGSVTASIPHPAFFDRPATVAQTASDLAHTERAAHIRLTYFQPVTSTLDVSVSAGPSFIHVTQGLATHITVPAGTQTMTLSTATQKGQAFGFNAGADANYMVSPGFGVGLFVRYSTARINLPDIPDLKVGGLQTGIGLRARF